MPLDKTFLSWVSYIRLIRQGYSYLEWSILYKGTSILGILDLFSVLGHLVHWWTTLTTCPAQTLQPVLVRLTQLMLPNRYRGRSCPQCSYLQHSRPHLGLGLEDINPFWLQELRVQNLYIIMPLPWNTAYKCLLFAGHFIGVWLFLVAGRLLDTNHF